VIVREVESFTHREIIRGRGLNGRCSEEQVFFVILFLFSYFGKGEQNI
jgi:hypothetical protein